MSSWIPASIPRFYLPLRLRSPRCLINPTPICTGVLKAIISALCGIYPTTSLSSTDDTLNDLLNKRAALIRIILIFLILPIPIWLK